MNAKNATDTQRGRTFAAAMRHQFTFTGALYRWPVVAFLVLAAAALLYSRDIQWEFERAAVRAYCQRINAQLGSDPRFNGVRAFQPMKGPFCFALDGRVRTQQDFDALMRFMEAAKPPEPYNPKGVFIRADTQ